MTCCPAPTEPSFLEAQDTAFSQLLSAAMSGFMEQVSLALAGEYNPAAQHATCAAGSEQWLVQLAHIGVLVAVEAPVKGVKVRVGGCMGRGRNVAFLEVREYGGVRRVRE